MSSVYKLWIDGEWVKGSSSLTIRSPFSNESVAEVSQASSENIEAALASAKTSFESFRKNSQIGRAHV